MRRALLDIFCGVVVLAALLWAVESPWSGEQTGPVRPGRAVSSMAPVPAVSSGSSSQEPRPVPPAEGEEWSLLSLPPVAPIPAGPVRAAGPRLRTVPQRQAWLDAGSAQPAERSLEDRIARQFSLSPSDARTLAGLDVRMAIQEAMRKVFPAVVFIRARQERLTSGRRELRDEMGSGFIISAQGEVLTNYHVVRDAVEVRCLLHDHQPMPARVLGADADSDLALLQLDLRDHTKPPDVALLGDSTRVKLGEFVMAMGAPWGLSRSVSIGIVSCTRLYLPEATHYSLWLQSDASTSPGHSGGPLVDLRGQVVGVNTRGRMLGGDLSFAVPSNLAAEVARQIRAHGSVHWSWSGLRLQPLKDFARNQYSTLDRGVIVLDSDEDSPAQRAGLKAGDCILSINGTEVTAEMEEELPEVQLQLAVLPCNEPAELNVLRAGQGIRVILVPRKKGPVEGQARELSGWDMTAKSINRFENPSLFSQRPGGAYVLGVAAGGVAESAGVRAGDILIAVGSAEIRSLDDLTQAYQQSPAQPGRSVILTLQRQGLRREARLGSQ